MAKYELRTDLNDSDTREKIRYLLEDLAAMDEDELTTFELNFIRTFTSNAPSKRHGSEWPQD